MRLLDSSGLLVVAAGTTQETATLLMNGMNGVVTAAASSGVILGAQSLTSDCQVVYNGGANAVRVYPPVGSKINALTANTPHILATNTTCIFWFLSDTQIIGVLSA
jgi:hypothetical protein